MVSQASLQLDRAVPLHRATMSRPTRRGRPVKRKLSEADISDCDHDQQSNQDYAPEFDEVVHDDFEVQPNQARHETATTPNINVIHHPGGKRQKFTQPDSQFDNEFVEIEYVDKSRHSFSKKNGLTGDLPPIHDIEQIFEQITLHAVQTPGFYHLLDALNGRELRVATVCSGTESPILALEMVVSCELALKDDSNPTLTDIKSNGSFEKTWRWSLFIQTSFQCRNCRVQTSLHRKELSSAADFPRCSRA